jgi:ATP-dependent exoDNAse (exonuclease V) beta subunit
MEDPFGAFEADFGAARTPLFNNYRSSPDLVRIQHVFAQALDESAVNPVSKAGATIDDENCAIWEFRVRIRGQRGSPPSSRAR